MVSPQDKSHDVVCDGAAADINVYFEKVGLRVVHHLREVRRGQSIRIHKKIEGTLSIEWSNQLQTNLQCPPNYQGFCSHSSLHDPGPLFQKQRLFR